MGEAGQEPGMIMKFIQDYRFKMLIPEILVVFALWYLVPDSLSKNLYQLAIGDTLGPITLILQPLFFVPSGILAFVTAFTLHGIYPLDNYHEGKIPDLPRAAVVMIVISFILLPWLVLMQMIGYYMTEATEYISRNPLWERIESIGDLFFYAGAVFFVGLQWWLLIPVFFLSQAVDGIHKIAHHETSHEGITALFYFLWPVTLPLFFDPVEIMAMAALSIPAFAFYSYIRPYYTYVTAVHTISFALIVLVTVLFAMAGITMPMLEYWIPGAIPGGRPPVPTPWW